MAKAAKNTADEEGEKESTVDSKDILSKFLNENEEDHLNFVKSRTYRVSTGSLMWDFYLNGGLPPGLSRFTGPPESGKTSAMFEIARNFLSIGKNRKVLYIKAEGRLSEEMQKRCGLNFVTSADDWEDGSVFVFKTNIFESVIGLIQKLLEGNEKETYFCFIIDSMDGLILRDDYKKTFEENVKVAGAPLLTKRFFQKLGARISELGHMVLMTTQYSSNIEIQYTGATEKRSKQGGGGWALAHYANYAFDFSETFNAGLIKEFKDQPIGINNRQLGKIVKVKFTKSPNEQSNMIVEYPVKNGVVGGSSVWKTYEIFDILTKFKLINSKGAWSYLADESQFDEMIKAGANPPEGRKWNGGKAFLAWLDGDLNAQAYFGGIIRKLI